MFIKQRKVRKSKKFSPRYIRSTRRRREVMVSSYSIAVLQFALSIALVIASFQSFVLFQRKVTDLSQVQKYAIPVLFLFGGLFLLRASIYKFKALRDARRDQHRGNAN